jgi:hypothetical protein
MGFRLLILHFLITLNCSGYNDSLLSKVLNYYICIFEETLGLGINWNAIELNDFGLLGDFGLKWL